METVSLDGAAGPRMLDVYRVGPVRTATRGLAVVAPVAVSGLKGMRTRFGLVQGLSVALTHGVVAVLIVGGWPYAIFSVTICRRV